MTSSLLANLTACSIVAALVCLGVSAMVAVLMAVKTGGRREDPLEPHDALSVSRFTIPVSLVVIGDGAERSSRLAASPTAGLNEAIGTMLALDYPEFEVVVVVEQPDEKALDALKADWKLEPKEFFFRQTLGTAAVRRIYRSALDAKLIVVDKARAGIADALNCGVNLARFRYIAMVKPEATLDRDSLLRAMSPALRDPAHVVATVSHLEPGGTEARTPTVAPEFRALVERLRSLRSLMGSRLVWRRMTCGLSPADALVIWRRDAVLQAGGFDGDAVDPALDMMIRLQDTRHRPDAGRVVRTAEIVGRVPARRLETVMRLVGQRQHAAIQLLWRHRAAFGIGTLGWTALPCFAIAELVSPALGAWAILGTALGAAAGWFAWGDVAVVVLALSAGRAMVTNGALLLRGSAPEPPTGPELKRLLLAAPFELVVQAPALAWARVTGGRGVSDTP